MIVVLGRVQKPVAGAAPPAQLLYDTFTDAAETLLTAHTMNVGAGWTVTYKFQITSNEARSSQSHNDFAHADAGVGDVDSTVMIKFSSSSAHGNVVRLVDINNHWQHYLSMLLSVHRIRERNAGLYTVRASQAFTFSAGVWYTSRLIANGTALTARLDGANELTYTSSLHQTNTRCGLFSETVNACRFDNFEVLAA